MFLAAAITLGGAWIGATRAMFGATAANGENVFEAGYWAYCSFVIEDSPSFRWRMGDGGSGASVFSEDFEGGFGWTDYRSGTFSASTTVARSGTTSGLKDSNNDPNGGWHALGFTTGSDWNFEAWIYRPSSSSGGGSDRVALEDSSFDGYGIQVDHGNDRFRIERRTGGSGSALSTVSFSAPEDQWYRVTLARTGSNLTGAVYDASGSQLATTSTTDSTHGPADRFVVHGGYQYYVDDISVSSVNVSSTGVAVDAMGNLDGTYVGSPSLGEPSLIDAETDTAVRFDGTNQVTLGDGSLLNTSARTQRSAELWFQADSTSGRQVLYEEGGATNGMVVYLEGTVLRARAWSRSTSWSNELDTTVSITTGEIYHVVVTLDTSASTNLILYLDGTAVDSASKSDTSQWSAHSDNGGIATQNGSSRYHDGSTGSSGGYGFQGTIDEVAIYNSVLSASRVLLHWYAGSP